jgi:hypothetical protein
MWDSDITMLISSPAQAGEEILKESNITLYNSKPLSYQENLFYGATTKKKPLVS